MWTTSFQRFALVAILVAGLLLRIVGIGWGLPPVTPDVVKSDFRSSYAFDEDDALSGVAKTTPNPLKFDPKIYDWGTLHLELLLVALEASEKLGLVRHPWRVGYYQMIEGDFERVYVIGRSLTIAVALFSLWLVTRIGAQLGSAEAGLWAAALMAVSPNHILQSDQIRTDVTMTALVLVTAWLALRCRNATSDSRVVWVGLAGGLACSAKYSALFIVAGIGLWALWPRRKRWPVWAFALLGSVVGFLAGEPVILLNRAEVWAQIWKVLEPVASSSVIAPIPFPILLWDHAQALARFSIGVPATLAAIAGFVLILRRRGPWMLVALAASIAMLNTIPQHWPFLRYHLPAVPFFALAAGLALATLPLRWRAPAGAAAILVPLFGAVALIHYKRAPHGANLALEAILRDLPKGTAIARTVREVPPLDLRDYPNPGNPYVADLQRNPPVWLLGDDMAPLPAAVAEWVKTHYDSVLEFRTLRRFAWATLGERGAPYDWRYTHVDMVLYRLRATAAP